MTTPRALSDEELNSCLFRLSPSIVEKLRAHISFLNTRVEALKSENEKLKAENGERQLTKVDWEHIYDTIKMVFERAAARKEK